MAKIISNTLFGEKCANKINEILLSSKTVKIKVEEWSENLKVAVITMLKQSEYFSLQHDVSTNFSDQLNILVFICFEFNGYIEKEMLFYQSLSTKTTSKEVFKSVDNYIKQIK